MPTYNKDLKSSNYTLNDNIILRKVSSIIAGAGYYQKKVDVQDHYKVSIKTLEDIQKRYKIYENATKQTVFKTVRFFQ